MFLLGLMYHLIQRRPSDLLTTLVFEGHSEKMPVISLAHLLILMPNWASTCKKLNWNGNRIHGDEEDISTVPNILDDNWGFGVTITTRKLLV